MRIGQTTAMSNAFSRPPNRECPLGIDCPLQPVGHFLQSVGSPSRSGTVELASLPGRVGRFFDAQPPIGLIGAAVITLALVVFLIVVDTSLVVQAYERSAE